MPNILTTEETTTSIAALSNVKYDYKYPKGLDLDPHGSADSLHGKILTRVMRHARESQAAMENRYGAWRDIDKVLSAYITPKEKRDAKGLGDATQPIIIPTSFATLQTLLTYMVAAFLQDPYFRYTGVGPEDTIGAMLMTQVVSVQAHKFKMGLNLHTLWRDAFSYGLGAMAISWHKHMGYRRKSIVSEFPSFTGMFNEIRTRVTRSGLVVLYEGSELFNIDPYLFFPDPTVAAQDVQKGSYVGWLDRSNLTNLLEFEEEPGSDYFNVKYVKHIDGTSIHSKNIRGASTLSSQGIPRQQRAEFYQKDLIRPVDIVHMYINLIPSDWGLGKEDYPRKWWFAVAGDNVVIGAKALGLDHNMYPIVVASPDYDGYSVAPVSRMEIGYGTQHIIDWMFDSHIKNVRKALNDMFIVDPFSVNIKDIQNPAPGKIIRTRRANWGKGVQNLVEQLKVTDVTSNHMRDASILTDIHNKATGATDIIQGIMRQGGERRSATEAKGAQQAALSKLEKDAKIMAMQYHGDTGYMLAAHTQQLMSKDTYVEIIGEMEQELMAERGRSIQDNKARVRPRDIMIDYDLMPADGTIPGREPVDSWIEIFRIVHDSPILNTKFDIGRMFMHIARQLGARNVQDFLKKGGGFKADVQPDEQVAEAVQNGNAVPVGGNIGDSFGI